MITSNDDIQIVNQAMENDKVIGLGPAERRQMKKPTGPDDIYTDRNSRQNRKED